MGNLLWALGCQFIEPINELGIAATLLNEAVQSVAAVALALVATHAQHIELADEIAEYDGTVAGCIEFRNRPVKLASTCYQQGIHRQKTGDLFPAMKGLCIPYWWRASKNALLFIKERQASKWFRVMHGRRHHDGTVTGLWLASLHDAKRGPRQISQGASLLARQRTLLE